LGSAANNPTEVKKDVSNIDDSHSSEDKRVNEEVDDAESPPISPGTDDDDPSGDQNQGDDKNIKDLDIDKLLKLIGEIFASLEDPENQDLLDKES